MAFMRPSHKRNLLVWYAKSLKVKFAYDELLCKDMHRFLLKKHVQAGFKTLSCQNVNDIGKKAFSFLTVKQ